MPQNYIVLNPRYNYLFPNELYPNAPETPIPPFKVKYSRKKFIGNPIIEKITQSEEFIELGNVLGTQPRSLYPALDTPSNPIVQSSETPTPTTPTTPTTREPTPTVTTSVNAEAPATTLLEPTPTPEPTGIPDSRRYGTMAVQYAFRLFADFARNVVDNFSETITELAEALENTAEIAGEIVQSMLPHARLSYAQSIQLIRSGFAGIQNLAIQSQSLSGPLRNVGVAINEFIQTQSDNSRQVVEAFIRRYLAQPIVASMNDELRTRLMSILRELNQNRREASSIILGEIRNILESIVEVDQPSIPLIGSSESTGLVVQRPVARNTNVNQAMNEIVEGMRRLSIDGDGERILIDTVTLWLLSLLGSITTYGLRRIGK